MFFIARLKPTTRAVLRGRVWFAVIGALFGPFVCAHSRSVNAAGATSTSRSGHIANLRASSDEAPIYQFGGSGDGTGPRANIIADASGTLYGTTQAGGSCCGAVFRLSPTQQGYVETYRYNFLGGNDGSAPLAGLFRDTASGKLYGTTEYGGDYTNCSGGCGTIFQLTPSGSSYVVSILYRFAGYPTDGALPTGTLVSDSSGTLYGATLLGGAYGAGEVFKLVPGSSGFTVSNIYSFMRGSDGDEPVGPVTIAGGGIIYGATAYGGSSNCGTVFRLVPSGSAYAETVVHTFGCSPADGFLPNGGLVLDKHGTLFGTTEAGGSGSCQCGTIYSLTPSGTRFVEQVLHNFSFGGDGIDPVAGLVAGKRDSFYGTAYEGGAAGYGVVYKLTKGAGGYSEHVVHSFKGSPRDGAQPQSSLIRLNGLLYGTTFSGGNQGNCLGGCGTVFTLSP